jgi:predicted Zn-dependent protease
MTGQRGRLVRLLDADRILSKSECTSVAERVSRFARGGGETRVQILSWWNGELRWARNRVSLASDRRDIRVQVLRNVDRGSGAVSTNQLDDVSLEAAVRGAERGAALSLLGGRTAPGEAPAPPVAERPRTAIWSDATYTVTPDIRGEVARTLVGPAEAKGMLSAGYLEMRAGALMSVSSRRLDGPYQPWDIPYASWTQAQCSMTVRDVKGTGSGWAGLSGADWGMFDGLALASRALEKCLASRNPVALEPGRYTVILEPQAVADLMEIVVAIMLRSNAESGYGPWALAADDALHLWRTKLGLKVLDERISISHDPADPQQGILPEPWMQPVTWFDKGVLANLAYRRDYALQVLNENPALRGMTGYRMSGGETSIDEMIRTTTRGLLVTRFSDIRGLDPTSLLATGLTRDGLWLIEHGKISKAVKNFRFTESPLFVLNSIDQLGVPVPVFRPVKDPYEPESVLTPAIVPAIKARDFSFTSTIDAI